MHCKVLLHTRCSIYFIVYRGYINLFKTETYDTRKVKRKEKQKQMACKILMIVYTNTSFFSGEKRYRQFIITAEIQLPARCASDCQMLNPPSHQMVGLIHVLMLRYFLFNHFVSIWMNRDKILQVLIPLSLSNKKIN